jgi:hypothetical protein
MVVLSFALCCAALFAEWSEFERRRPIVLKGKRAIRDYMYGWLSQGGRAAVFSRDLSWVEDEQMIELLESKARRSELIVTVPHASGVLDRLREAGATINVYGDSDFELQSRFTIVNYGRSDARVAIGRSAGREHLVEEVGAGDSSAFAMANDIIKIGARLSGRGQREC